ncbi:GspH/FimT family pseudopilin [Solilutibacter silvestris]|nr:GspH/FimT family pseudopilin [Lysobacter silvestris]
MAERMARQMIRRRERGFTLIELMVTVAVLAIVAAIAAPSFTQLILRSRLTSTANEVVAALQLARMEAIRRNGSTDVCPTTDGSTCSGANWSRFIVVSHKGGDQVVREVVLAQQAVAIGNADTTAGSNKIGFGADGFAIVGGGRQGGVLVCMPKLPAASSTMQIDVQVSRVTVTPSNSAVAGCAP